MLDNHGFDLWSGGYDRSVQEADENNQYPFAGYAALMNAIYGTVMASAPAKVLDIGFGTAALTAKLYEGGNAITGIDFSTEMLKIAKAKMPGASLLEWDFTNGIPSVLEGERFDFIVSTYALHHLTDDMKVDFISKLDLLAPQGRILIGDVGFKTRRDLLDCQKACGDDWDDDEFYFVFAELKDRLCSAFRLEFHEFSFCAGIIEISNF